MRYLIERLIPHEPTDNTYNRMEKFLEHVLASSSRHDTKDTYPEANDEEVNPKHSLHQHSERDKEDNGSTTGTTSSYPSLHTGQEDNRGTWTVG